MDQPLPPWPDDVAPYEIISPDAHDVPFVFASPHSGNLYPPAFLHAARLTEHELRRSEDCHVDELYEFAPTLGAPLIRARYPRAYVDPNREPFELDPAMFAEDLPAFVNTTSPRVACGLGTIAKLVANGAEIYGEPLSFAEARARIEALYMPYHEALKALIETTKERFGFCVLIDCHSMPSVGGPVDEDNGLSRVDFVLGDRYGTACAPALTSAAYKVLAGQGYTVVRNTPYAGGYTTQHYGRPHEGVHALQIEVNRRLYMDELTYTKRDGFGQISAHLRAVADALLAVDHEDIRQVRPRRRPKALPPENAVIRASTEDDVPAIQAIYAHYVKNSTINFEEVPPTVADMAERRRGILAKGLPYLVAEHQGKVVGFSYAGPFRPRSAYRYTVESSIYLDPAMTGRGFGKALYAELIRQTRDLGFKQMIAVIGDAANKSSLALHKSLGFRQEGILRKVGVKFGRWLDIFMMHLSLDDEEED